MLPIRQFPHKYTGCYRCPNPIKNFKVRIKIKKVELANGKIDIEDGEWTELTFRWQEKIFSRTEKELYSDLANCVTDLEKKYNQIVGNATRDDLLFTYTNEDDYCVENFENVDKSVNYLQNMLDNVDLNGTQEHFTDADFDMEKSILSSIENPLISASLEKMDIMADFGEYIDTTWIQKEYPICTIKYKSDGNMLHIYPDFTKNRPYLIQINNESKQNYYYFVENAAVALNEGMLLQEQELFRKLIHNHISHKKNIVGKDFFLPPKNKLFLYLFFEILLAKSFEYSQIYVKYFVDLPTGWTCRDKNSLEGLTQVGCAKNEEKLVHFGYNFDIVLDYNIQNTKELPKCPYIYFEVISRDSWDICRNEGLAYKSIPTNQPGMYQWDLGCFRFGQNGVVGDLRRCFIGDCYNYDDVTWLGIPKDQEGPVLNKYGTNTVGTGSLQMRLNIVHQSQAFLDEFSDERNVNSREKLIFDKLKTSSLIKSVEEVLLAFKRARKNMLDARKKL